MFKLLILSAVLALAAAQPILPLGYPTSLGYSAPLGYPGALGYPAPVAYSSPLVKTALPVATSYANTYKLAVRNPYGPLTYAAPAIAAPAYASSPLVAPGPIAYSTGLGHPFLH